MSVPSVTDPTDAPSNTATNDGLPAILSGMAIESQLGQPITQNLRVRVDVPAPPTGLINEYANKIRMGAMSSNLYGSAYEVDNIGTFAAATNLTRVTPTKKCTSGPAAGTGTKCITEADCGGSASTTYCTVVGNMDGAAIISAIGKGHCSTTTATECTKQAHCPSGESCYPGYCSTTTATPCGTDSNCPTGETCITVGNHTTGLISSIDTLKAASWTPFAEAFYNAIGYFAMAPSDATGKTSRTDLRLNSGDFPDAMNPSEYVCQSNNILLITDGGSTADLNSDMATVVDTYKAVSGNATGACNYFQGSQNLDDLAWLARHRNINTFERTNATTTQPVKKNQMINTYVVSTGADNGVAPTSVCNNITLLNQTANKGGTSLLRSDLPEQYEDTLRKAFAQVAGGTASGTAASILSNSEGSGANILQAVFFPFKEFENSTSASWIGEMQNLWYFVDPYINNSTVREDTDRDNSLHIVNDFAVDFQFKGGETVAVLSKDTDGNGAGDTVVTSAVDPRAFSQGYCSTSTFTKCAADSACPSGETCVFASIVNADDVNSIWRAGKRLWERDISSVPRKLYTYLYGSSATGCTGTFSVNGLVDLVNWTALGGDDRCIIMKTLQASSLTEAQSIIDFAHGYDSAGSIDGHTPRNRTVAIARRNADGTHQAITDSHVWKLGDIIAS